MNAVTPLVAAMAPRLRAVVLDLDGTLLDSEHGLGEQRIAAVQELQRAGLEVLLATGKIWPSIAWISDRLHLDGPHVTCNGGAIVTADGRLLHTFPLQHEAVHLIGAQLTRRKIPHALFLDDGAVVTPTRGPELDIVGLMGEPDPTEDDVGDRRTLKILGIVAEREEDGIRAAARDRAHVQRTGPRFLEWTAPGVDKGAGVRLATEALGCSTTDVIAIGDAENDVPMLQVAGLSVAVAGASAPAVAASAIHLEQDLNWFLELLAQIVSTAGGRRAGTAL